jgi:hypothetical protein
MRVATLLRIWRTHAAALMRKGLHTVDALHPQLISAAGTRTARLSAIILHSLPSHKEVTVKRFLVLLLLLNAAFAFSQTKKQSGTDPWAGTYKLDTARSKFSGPAPKEETVTVDAASKDSVKYTITGTDSDNKPYTISYDGKVGTPSSQTADGKEVAQITYQMPSSHQFTSESKGSDGGSGSATITLSRDNKTITVREHSKDAKGAAHEQTTVYTRQ